MSAKGGKPKYTLTYFNLRARGEVARLLFVYAGKDFVDERIEQKDWPKLKPKTPGGTLPYLTIDDKTFGQSLAIVRYLASEFGLFGKTKLEQLAADEMLEDVEDMMKTVIKPVFETDEAKKAELLKEFEDKLLPAFVKKHEDKLPTSGHYVGKTFTVADFAVHDILDGITKRGGDKCLANAPKLKALMAKVREDKRIKEYLKKRPDTVM
ncbi:glutathione S-transferase-like [Ylistrum balloti]|uniref:glutathione S-transferase-like n=1 Tax=Ylistrum balloti TaxID=509963 RepID=UPI002905920E|nr:glutathione S-transferase-like [Ylistrum balloti]